MTKAELIKKLSAFAPDAQVYVRDGDLNPLHIYSVNDVLAMKPEELKLHGMENQKALILEY